MMRAATRIIAAIGPTSAVRGRGYPTSRPPRGRDGDGHPAAVTRRPIGHPRDSRHSEVPERANARTRSTQPVCNRVRLRPMIRRQRHQRARAEDLLHAGRAS
jgi:hypothetical protein